jgi:Poxvirus Late Transcription Factor VLTF3 like
MEARYDERVRACKTQDELAEYLLSCIPVIKEYTNGASQTEETTTHIANLKVATKKGVQRNDIYKKYLQEVEQEAQFLTVRASHEKPCQGCGKMYTRIFDEVTADEICRECGTVEFVLGDSVGFKEEQDLEKHVVYSYKRENHFNEWISQFQAKESTTVPEEVIGKLRTEFRKQKVKDLGEITHEKVKGLLKKLGYAKYYEHVPYIATIVSGITPPTMPQALEDKLRLMFHAIQAPFEKHKPANRKNFLSYSFVLYKMCELLDQDEYLKCFPLLKSREKLYVQDQIWEKICNELRWEFIRTT